MTAALLETTNDATAEALEWIAPPRPKRRLTAASAVCIGGSIALAVAAIGLALGTTSGQSSADGSAEPEAAPPAAAAAPRGFPDVGVTDLSYLPGHSSGWHIHPGVHSVVVLAGTLTVYDEACGRTDFGLGQTYLGGSRSHLVRNEGSDVLAVAVTYVYAGATKTDHGGTVSAPAGCEPR